MIEYTRFFKLKNAKEKKLNKEIKYKISSLLNYHENKEKIKKIKKYLKNEENLSEEVKKILNEWKNEIKLEFESKKEINILLPPTKNKKNHIKKWIIKEFKEFKFYFIEIKSDYFNFINLDLKKRKEKIEKVYKNWELIHHQPNKFNKKIYLVDDVFTHGTTISYLLEFLTNKKIFDIKNLYTNIINNLKIITLSITNNKPNNIL